jgi:hypothetical protein
MEPQDESKLVLEIAIEKKDTYRLSRITLEPA